MVPGDNEHEEDNEVQGAGAGNGSGVDEGEANNEQPADPVDVPIQGSPGGVYRVGEDGKRYRVQD